MEFNDRRFPKPTRKRRVKGTPKDNESANRHVMKDHGWLGLSEHLSQEQHGQMHDVAAAEGHGKPVSLHGFGSVNHEHRKP